MTLPKPDQDADAATANGAAGEPDLTRDTPLGDDPAGQAATAPADASALRDQVAALEAEVADLKDRLLHSLADLENSRRRFERDKQEAQKYAVSSLARELLTVADQLDMALAAVKPEQRADNPLLNTMLVGVEATARALGEVMAKSGVRAIEIGEHQRFDPNQHEVMTEVPGTGLPGGTIVQVLQRGYRIADRLLRPARVIVARGEDPPRGVDQSI